MIYCSKCGCDKFHVYEKRAELLVECFVCGTTVRYNIGGS